MSSLRQIILGFILACSLLADFCHAEPANIRSFKSEEIGASDIITSISQDNRGLIYFMSSSAVFEYDGNRWQKITALDQINVTALSTHPNGRIFIGANEELGFLTPNAQGMLDLTSLKSSLPESERKGFTIESIMHNAESTYFVGSKQVFILTGKNLEVLPLSGRAESAFIAVDKLHIIDADQGLLQLNGKEFKTIPKGNFFRVRSSLATAKDVLFATRSSGLLRYIPSIEGQTPFDAMIEQDNDFFHEMVITDMKSFKNGTYVFSTLGNGIAFASEKGKITKQVKESGLKPIGDVYAVFVDKKDNIWFSSNTGIGIVLAEAATTAEASTGSGDDSIPFFALIRKCQDLRTRDIIFGGSFFKELGGVQTLEGVKNIVTKIPFEQNSISFYFASNMVDASEGVQYQSMMSGIDKDWSEWTRNDSRDFTNLYWNDYVFQVRAKDAHGKISKVSTFYFRVTPPWYESIWFYILEAFILASLLVLAGVMKGLGNPVGDLISEKSIVILVSIFFSYLLTKVGYYGLIATLSSGVIFVKLALSAGMGLFMGPVQDRLKLFFVYLTLKIPPILRLFRSKIRKRMRSQSEETPP